MHDFTVVVLAGAYPSSVAVTVDLLSAAAALAARVGAAAPRWRVCSVAGGTVSLQGGLAVATDRLPARARDDRSTWVLPGLGVTPSGGLAERLGQPDAMAVAAALARHVQRGGRVAASCTSVFILHAAGLLRGRRATTSWWLAPLLKRQAPECQVDADRMVCADGPVTTAGAALAQTDLVLHLLRAQAGHALADLVARMLLIDGREAQAPYVAPDVLAGGHALVAQLASRIEAALPQVPTVRALAQACCLSERSLSRHVHQATGGSTLALVQRVKLQRARALLEGSRMTVDQVAAAVGYQDATALRRMMKKVAGTRPSRYRPPRQA